jgi:hypothetical protein
MYARSFKSDNVEAFVSHPWSFDPQSAVPSMRQSWNYANHKCMDIIGAAVNITARKLAEGQLKLNDFSAELFDLEFWVDKCCVSQEDVEGKMEIIKYHLHELIMDSPFVIIVMTPVYFTRLWCIYEFVFCLQREDLTTLVIANNALCHFDLDLMSVADVIVNMSVANGKCAVAADAQIIEDNIKDHFTSVPAFENLAKFAAIALCARQALWWAAEENFGKFRLWGEAARRLNFDKLATEIHSVDLEKIRSRMFAAFPDAPGETRAAERAPWCEANVTGPWFRASILPLLRDEQIVALKPSGILSRKSRVYSYQASQTVAQY